MRILDTISFAYLLMIAFGLFAGLWRETVEDDSVFGVGLLAILLFVVAAFILYL